MTEQIWAECVFRIAFYFVPVPQTKTSLHHIQKKYLFVGAFLYLEDVAAAHFLGYNKLQTPKSPVLGEKAKINK